MTYIHRYSIFAAGILFATSAFATTLSPEAALSRIYGDSSGRRAGIVSIPELSGTIFSMDGKPAVYVFSRAEGGSVIVSASDRAMPLLGYTDSGTLDVSNLPPQLEFWLDQYVSQIAFNESRVEAGMPQGYTYPADWTYIAPLLKTKWDQGAPYNDDVYPYATGCVATAMAQIMKYHEWPLRGHGSNSYTDAYGRTYSMDFGLQDFEWGEMLASYEGGYTQAQASAVAYLMKACGYSTDMNYSGSSGTQAERAGLALVSFFDYDASIEVLQRHEYTHTEWATILYNQLQTVGPVLYSGSSLGGFAHAFVADGYDGNGYFHINWGWSGKADGFYALDALIPSTQGTGGSSYGGYNFTQGMIVNIMKDTSSAEFVPRGQLTLLGNVSGTMEGHRLTMTMTEANPGNICNNSLLTVTPVFGIRIENVLTGESRSQEVSEYYFGGEVPEEKLVFGPGSLIAPRFSISAVIGEDLPEGEYKVSLVWKEETSEDGGWQNFITANGCHDFIYLSKYPEGYLIENISMDRFVIDSIEWLGPVYMHNPVEVRFTLTNPTDAELTQSIVPVLLYGDNRLLSFEGDSRLFTVGPNETITATATYTLSQIKGGQAPTASTPREYTVGAYDYDLMLGLYYQSGYFGESYYGDLGTVTMMRPGTNASLKPVEISVANASEEYSDGQTVYGVEDFSNIRLEVKAEGINTFLAVPLSAVVTELGNSDLNPVYEKNFEGLLYVWPDEISTIETTLNMPEYDVSKIYQVNIYYVRQNTRQQLGSVLFGASSGVSGVTSDNLSTVEIYDLNGRRVYTSYENLGKGIYIIRTFAADGTIATHKIIRK